MIGLAGICVGEVSLCFQLLLNGQGVLSVKICRNEVGRTCGAVPLKIPLCGHVFVGTFFFVFVWESHSLKSAQTFLHTHCNNARSRDTLCSTGTVLRDGKRTYGCSIDGKRCFFSHMTRTCPEIKPPSFPMPAGLSLGNKGAGSCK